MDTIDKEKLRGILQDYIQLMTVSGGMYDYHTDKAIAEARLMMNELEGSANTNSAEKLPTWYDIEVFCTGEECDSFITIITLNSGWADGYTKCACGERLQVLSIKEMDK
jgi:hypothetical protein